VAGSCDTPRRNRKNDGARNSVGLVRNTSSEPEERPISERWRARAKLVAGTGRTTVLGSEQWSTVGRFWVDGEREGKFGGKSGKKSEKMGCSFGFCFQILKFLNFLILFFL
jgi:hypothetical protein